MLAGGSNVVIADDLTDLTVVRLANAAITRRRRCCCAPKPARCGTTWWSTPSRPAWAVWNACRAFPGSAGATPVQNVGAYGVEVADTLTRVRLLDRRSGEVRWVPAAELGFGYRHSVLKNSADAVVLEVEFALDPAGRSRAAALRRALGGARRARRASAADPADVRAAVLGLRAGKGMVLDAVDHDTWSVGSFFTNPVVPTDQFEALQARHDGPVPHYPAPDGVKLAAGWLVEHAGFGKGYPGPEARLPVVHQACAGADQPRPGDHQPTCWRWPEPCATVCVTCSASPCYLNLCWSAACSSESVSLSIAGFRILD